MLSAKILMCGTASHSLTVPRAMRPDAALNKAIVRITIESGIRSLRSRYCNRAQHSRVVSTSTINMQTGKRGYWGIRLMFSVSSRGMELRQRLVTSAADPGGGRLWQHVFDRLPGVFQPDSWYESWQWSPQLRVDLQSVCYEIRLGWGATLQVLVV